MKGIVLRKLIKDNGISLAEVADKLNISPQLLQNWLNVDELKIDKFEKIINVLNDGVNSSIYKEYPALMKYKHNDLPTTNQLTQEDEIMRMRIEMLEMELKNKKRIIEEKESVRF